MNRGGLRPCQEEAVETSALAKLFQLKQTQVGEFGMNSSILLPHRIVGGCWKTGLLITISFTAAVSSRAILAQIGVEGTAAATSSIQLCGPGRLGDPAAGVLPARD